MKIQVINPNTSLAMTESIGSSGALGGASGDGDCVGLPDVWSSVDRILL